MEVGEGESGWSGNWDLTQISLRFPDAMDSILDGLSLKTLKALQMTSKLQYWNVVNHRSWDDRLIRIRKDNAEDIGLMSPMRIWSAADIELPIPGDKFEDLEYILQNLQYLRLSHTNECPSLGCMLNVSLNMRSILSNCKELTTLHLDNRLLHNANGVLFFDVFKNLAPNIIHLDIFKAPGIYCPDGLVLLLRNVRFMAELNWRSLSTLKVGFLGDSVNVYYKRILEKAASTLTTLDFEEVSEPSSCLGVEYIPNLKHVTIRIPRMLHPPYVYDNMVHFLKRQPLLYSLEIIDDRLDIFPSTLLETIGSRSSQLRSLELYVSEFEIPVSLNVSFEFLKEAKHLETLALVGDNCVKKPSQLGSFPVNIMEIIKNNGNIKFLQLPDPEFDWIRYHRRKVNREKLEKEEAKMKKIAKSYFPKLVNSTFDMLDCD